MSRSYKKNPVYTDGRNGQKKAKRIAAKKVRNFDIEALPSKGNQYKKVSESYNIHDYVSRWTWEEAVDWYHKHPEQYSEYPTEKEFYRYWYKISKMK